jgi:hypothetical protein
MSTLVYQPNHFNADAVGLILAPLWEPLPRDAPECTALQEATLAMLYPFIPPDSFYDENGRNNASVQELIADTQRGHSYVAYLEPWAERIVSSGIALQRDFLVRCGLITGHTVDGPTRDDALGLMEEEEDDSTETEIPAVIVYPRPAQAIDTLRRLALKYESTSIQHAAIELAILSLQYIIDSGQEEPFVVFLEEGQKPCPPEKIARFGFA